MIIGPSNVWIEALINRYLECDPECAAQLQEIEGKTISIFVREINRRVIVLVEDMRVRLVDSSEKESGSQESDNEESTTNIEHQFSGDSVKSDVTIELSLSAIPGFLMGEESGVLVKQDKLAIEGDTHVASVFSKVLKDIEIDWEEHLARYTGDPIAYHAGRGVDKARKYAQQSRENFRQDAKEYLQEEIRVLPASDELKQFMRDVDELRADTERLIARTKKLESAE